jgi:putative membrane protein
VLSALTLGVAQAGASTYAPSHRDEARSSRAEHHRGWHHRERSSRLSSDDVEFLKSAAQGARFEIDGGRLALTHASSPAAKAFGMRMIRDHGAELWMVERLAARYGIHLPSTPTEKQQSELARFASERGATFDRDYLSTEVTDHHQDIHDQLMEVRDGQASSVRHLAAKEIPTLVMHLHFAEFGLYVLNQATSSS